MVDLTALALEAHRAALDAFPSGTRRPRPVRRIHGKAVDRLRIAAMEVSGVARCLSPKEWAAENQRRYYHLNHDRLLPRKRDRERLSGSNRGRYARHKLDPVWMERARERSREWMRRFRETNRDHINALARERYARKKAEVPA